MTRLPPLLDSDWAGEDGDCFVVNNELNATVCSGEVVGTSGGDNLRLVLLLPGPPFDLEVPLVLGSNWNILGALVEDWLVGGMVGWEGIEENE